MLLYDIYGGMYNVEAYRLNDDDNHDVKDIVVKIRLFLI